MRLFAVFSIFSRKYLLFAIRVRSDVKNRICLEGRLVCDLEDFDFLDFEIFRTRENRFPVQPSVVDANTPKVSGTAGICVAIIANNHVTKVWTPGGKTTDCAVLHFGLQGKLPRRDVMWILQGEKKLFRLSSLL
jgi:hypothetical protein